MLNSKWFYVCLLLIPSLVFGLFTQPVRAQGVEKLELVVNDGNLEWHTGWGEMTEVLTLEFPDGSKTSYQFKEDKTPLFSVLDAYDGNYLFELVGIPEVDYTLLSKWVSAEDGRDRVLSGLSDQETYLWSGSFSINDGQVFLPSAETGLDIDLSDNMIMDVLHYDDVIVTGSLCVGFDCVDGESFGYATIKLKENNLQLLFEDTSTSTFPSNDWKIQVNDTTSGGQNYFTIWDVDAGRRPFTIEAGAPAHSLYVEDYGRVGLGTSIPFVELHIVDGDSPTIRLDQDGSSGWAAQSWDIAGNETNFFVRDVTNGSKLSFRIQPNTPSNTLTLKSSGYVGIGTWSPEANLEIETTGQPAALRLQQTDGSTWDLTTSSDGFSIENGADVSPLVIEKGALENMLFLSANGFVGIGTNQPTTTLFVEGTTTLDGSTAVMDDFSVTGQSLLNGNTSVTGELNVSGSTEISDDFSVTGQSLLNGDASVTGELNVSGSTEISDDFTVVGKTSLTGDTSIIGKAQVSGDTTVGGTLDVAGNAAVDGNLVLEGYLSEHSDVNAKENFKTINSSEILEKVSQLPITTWNYIDDAGITHIGPMAQDFYNTFEVGLDDKHLSALDVNGVTLASIQELNRLVDDKETRIVELEQQLDSLQDQVNQNSMETGVDQQVFLFVLAGTAFLMGSLGMILGGVFVSKKLKQ